MRRQRTTRPSRLTRARILKMAKVHFRQKGQWPTKRSGPVAGEPNETWAAIDLSLKHGYRGLAGGSSLAQLLAEAGVKRHRRERPRLNLELVLTWAEADQRQT